MKLREWIVTTEEVRRYRVEYVVEAKSAEEAREKFQANGNETEEMLSTISQEIESVAENR